MTQNTINAWLTEPYLRSQIEGVLEFYHQHAICPEGGFYQQLKVTGEHHPDRSHQLVSTTRIVVNFARGMMLFGKPEYEANVRHGLAFIRQQHRWGNGQGYHWLLKDGIAKDSDQYCYAYAFLILAYANAMQAGIEEAGPWLQETFDLMDKYFWQSKHGLYADQRSADLQHLYSYRGQNANMHACEAMLAAYDATQDEVYLLRAQQVARNIVVRNTQATEGLLWEHYTQDWQVDWAYNKHDPQNLYKPWGYQPGHFTEWSKLLLMLHAHSPDQLFLERAQQLMDVALAHSWDNQYGGLYYGFDPSYQICDEHKYFWVQAETLAALAWLFKFTGNAVLLDEFGRLASYIEKNFVVPGKFIWYRLLSRKNQQLEEWIASPGAKCDYHNLGACYDIIRSQTSINPNK